MKRLIAACLAFLATQAFAFAQLGQDISDMWWNPAESGWGMNVVQQSDVTFITIFAYGAGNAPTWFVASNVAYQGFDSVNNEHVHSGTLYQTTGPVYSAATFDPNQVTVRAVGVITLRVGTTNTTTTLYTGRLSYTVDGVTVNKSIVRQAFRTANHAGSYYAAMRETWSNCSTASNNGEYVAYGNLTITQTAATPPVVSMQFVSSDATFAYTFAGAYYQSGRNGVIPAGTITTFDTNNNTGSGTAIGMDIVSGTTGMSATFSLAGINIFTGCTISARLGAAK